MKVVVAYEVPESKFEEVSDLVAASAVRDIDLNGVSIEVVRGEYTCVEESEGEDAIDAARVLKAIHSVIDGTREAQTGKGLTIFNCFYDRDRHHRHPRPSRHQNPLGAPEPGAGQKAQ